ncbi:MAG TPA: hypothetical protein VF219_05150 [Vicinamibacterales bacterium]
MRPNIGSNVRMRGSNTASHQTGWTGSIARIMHLFATTPAERFLEMGRKAAVLDVRAPEPSVRAGRS